MNKRIICGLDYSINSPGIVWVKMDNEFNVEDRAWLTFTNKKKYISDSVRYIGTAKGKRTYPNSLEQAGSVRDIIWKWVCNQSGSGQSGVAHVDCVVFEDYALAAKGRVFHIAETTMAMKLKLFEDGFPLRLYPPNHIKLFATGHGNADKFEMENAYEALSSKERKGMDLTCLPTLKEQKNGNPRDNVIDAFWATELLRTELRLRNGLILLRDLPEHQIRVFNLTTKSYPTNVLARNFLQKGVVYD